MSTTVEAKVRRTGQYVDGRPALEIHVPVEQADGLPYELGARVPITLKIGRNTYQAGLRSTAACAVVWISPDFDGVPRHEKPKLVDALLEAGIGANDAVRLLVNEKSIAVQPTG